MNCLGHGALPQASFAASSLQQTVVRLKDEDLLATNRALSFFKRPTPAALYKSPCYQSSPVYLAFSDASQVRSLYGQAGYIVGVYFHVCDGGVFHVIDWMSAIQKRVSFLSIRAELIAAATSTDRASHVSEGLKQLCGSQKSLPLILTVDSNGLYTTLTTLHEGSDYRLRPVVSRLRDSFECEKIATIQWFPEQQNIADALTMLNPVSHILLNDVMSAGQLRSAILENKKRSKFSSDSS